MTEPLKTEQDDGEGAETAPHSDAVPEESPDGAAEENPDGAAEENPDGAAARALDHQILQDLGPGDQPNEQDER